MRWALGRGSPITLGSLSGHCSIGCMSSSTDYYSLSTKKMLKIVTKKKGGKQLGPSSTHPVAKPDFFICQNCGILKPAARSQFNPTPISERIQFCVNGLPVYSFNILVNLFVFSRYFRKPPAQTLCWIHVLLKPLPMFHRVQLLSSEPIVGAANIGQALSAGGAWEAKPCIRGSSRWMFSCKTWTWALITSSVTQLLLNSKHNL